MTRRAVTRGMVRRVASALVAGTLGLAALPAMAGDAALIDYIGYSPDGRYFAFEEYGIQDGSGFGFSNIYVVDLVNDRWVTGTPFRVVIEDFEGELVQARASAAQQAADVLNELEVATPAHLLALNGDGDPRTGDGKELEFGRPGYGLSEPVEVQTLTLEAVERPSGLDCEIIENETFGFVLRLDGTTVHRDTGAIPRSRGCVMDYRIHSVLRPYDYAMAPGGALAVISVYPFGFEGPDRRFLVVPLD